MLVFDCGGVLFRCLPSLQLQTELQRLEVLKMSSIRSFVETVRAEIAHYWEKCFYSPEQREAFAPYHAGESSATTECVCLLLLWDCVRQRLWSFDRRFHRGASKPTRGGGQDPAAVLRGAQRAL